MQPSAPSPSATGAPHGGEWMVQVADHLEAQVWVWDLRTRQVSYANPAAVRFWGGSPVGQPGLQALLDQVHPDDRTRVARSRQLLESGGPASLNEEYRTLGARDGADAPSHRHGAWIRERALAVCDAAGARVAITHIATDVTRQLGLADLTGWWNGVTTGDFDGDGRLDIAASNWGRNHKYQSHRDRPLRVLYGEMNGDGITDIIEAFEITLAKPTLVSPATTRTMSSIEPALTQPSW